MKAARKKQEQNFHLPLSSELHSQLKQAAAEDGVTSTALARKALEGWLRARARRKLFSEISSYAAEVAGSQEDLDEEIESASLDFLAHE